MSETKALPAGHHLTTWGPPEAAWTLANRRSREDTDRESDAV